MSILIFVANLTFTNYSFNILCFETTKKSLASD